jgi:hypothetical protein
VVGSCTPVNITPEILFDWIFAIAGFIGFGVSFNQLRKGYHYRLYEYSAIAWFFAGINGILYGFANLFLVDEIMYVALIAAQITCLFTVLCADTLRREQGEPVILAIMLTLITLAIISFILVPNAIAEHYYALGVVGLYPDRLVGLIFVGTGTLSFGYYFYCAYLVNKRVPASLKRYSRPYVTGVFLVLVATVGFAILQPYLPGSTFLAYSIGGILMAYAYGSEPKLIFVLPFRALRLTVLNTVSGVSLFTHTWNQQGDLVDEDIFSSMLQGINMIVQASLQRGKLQEIRAEGAIIIACQIPEYKIACMLVATRPTRSLRDGLKLFAEKFCQQFKDSLMVPNNVAKCCDAEDLVNACFPHIPIYK